METETKEGDTLLPSPFPVGFGYRRLQSQKEEVYRWRTALHLRQEKIAFLLKKKGMIVFPSTVGRMIKGESSLGSLMGQEKRRGEEFGINEERGATK